MSKVSKLSRTSQSAHKALAHELLMYFYPVHYRIGMDLETVMCQGRISRKQAALLWLIHTSGRDSGWVRRREIELLLSDWFEISNSNVSKLLRELSKPPLSLVEQVENPASGREKIVRLTKAGQSFLDGMIQAGVGYLAEQMSHIENDEFSWGVDFAALAFGPDARAARLNGALPSLKAPPASLTRHNQRTRRK